MAVLGQVWARNGHRLKSAFWAACSAFRFEAVQSSWERHCVTAQVAKLPLQWCTQYRVWNLSGSVPMTHGLALCQSSLLGNGFHTSGQLKSVKRQIKIPSNGPAVLRFVRADFKAGAAQTQK